MRNKGWAQSCSSSAKLHNGSSEISTGKKRQCIAQTVDTLIPSRSQMVVEVNVLSDNEQIDWLIKVCTIIHTLYVLIQSAKTGYSSVTLVAIICMGPCIEEISHVIVVPSTVQSADTTDPAISIPNDTKFPSMST